MSKTMFNKEVVDFTKQPIFFGEELSTQRYDKFKYEIFDKLTEQQLGFFWRPQEISLQKDRNDFQSMREEQKFIFTANLKYQTLLDSVQGRGPVMAFLPYTSLPELEACIQIWTTMEMIHSRSYTYIMKNVFADPSEVFDTILNDKAIIKRAISVTRYYDDYVNFVQFWEMRENLREDHVYADVIKNRMQEDACDVEIAWEYELKKRLYLALLTVNVLEGIRFYVSFACTFAFAENKLMEGSAKILQLIARDESQHLAITQHIIKCYRNYEKDEVMTKAIQETEPQVYELYREAVAEEKEWSKHLFEKGSMIGLNEQLLSQYIEYMANKRMKAIGLRPIFDQKLSENPLPWTINWLSSKAEQVAPQQVQLSSYLIGSMNQDAKGSDFEDFDL